MQNNTLKIMNWYIGQKVICITTKHPYLQKGKIYTIYNILKCKCGSISFHVGIAIPKNIVKFECAFCSYIEAPIQHIWSNSKFFCPLEWDIISNTEIIKESVPEKLDTPEKL